MTALYGQLFINKQGARDSGIWLETLVDLTPKAIESGVSRLQGLSCGTKFCEWPPSPLEFKALCQAFYEDLKLPSSSAAFQEVSNMCYSTRKHWSHAIVKLAASGLPADFFKSEDKQELVRIFNRVYEQVVSQVRQGNPIPPLWEIKEPVACFRKIPTLTIGGSHIRHLKQMLGS